MAYLTRALLEPRVGGPVRYVELTDDDRDDVPDTAVETFLLTGTDSTADAYFTRGGYTVPVTDSAALALMQPYLLDIANYKAKTRGGRLASEPDLAAYTAALAWFEAIATGDIILPGYAGTVIGAPVLIGESDTPLMTADYLRGL